LKGGVRLYLYHEKKVGGNKSDYHILGMTPTNLEEKVLYIEKNHPPLTGGGGGDKPKSP